MKASSVVKTYGDKEPNSPSADHDAQNEGYDVETSLDGGVSFHCLKVLSGCKLLAW